MVKNTFREILLVLFLLLAGGLVSLWAQEQGNVYISNYGPKEYEGHPQNFAVTQDDNGLLYLANSTSGLIIYDGKVWQKISSPNKTARSISKAPNGLIYAGFNRDFGYIQRDSTQQLRYHSLSKNVDEAHKVNSTIWHIHTTEDKVYFYSNSFLYIWSNGIMKYIELNNEFYRQFYVNDVLYLNNKKTKTLYKVVNDQLVKIEINQNPIQKLIAEMLPYDDRQILVVSRYEGLFLFDPEQNTLTPLGGDVSPRLKKDRINSAVYLQDGNIAIGSAFSGAMIIDKQGNLIHSFDKSSGIDDLTVWNIFVDPPGNLLLATNNGVTKIEITTGLDYWDSNNGLEGVPLSMKRINNQLYIASTVGVFYLAQNTFHKVEGIDWFCPHIIGLSSVTSPEDMIIAGTDKGIYEIKNNKAFLVNNSNISFLYKYEKRPNTLIGVRGRGDIFVLVFNGTSWEDYAVYNDLSDIGIWITSATEDEQGNIWFGTEESGVYLMKNPMLPDQVSFSQYTVAQGLPADLAYSVERVDDRLLLYSPKGFYKWIPTEGRFEADPAMSYSFGFKDSIPNIYPLSVSENGNVWLYNSKTENNQIIGAIKNSEFGFTIDTSALKRIQPDALTTIFQEEVNDNVWIGTPDRLYRYQAQKATTTNHAFNATINRISINGDSTLFVGHLIGSSSQEQNPVFQYDNNFIRFTFGSTCYTLEDQTQFSYRLKGYDDQWSDWSIDDYKEFTNLREGVYTFELKSKNIYEEESNICQYPFEVMPPWYRSGWAYFAYLLLSTLLIYLIVRFYNKRLKRENERLETLVQERTKEVEKQRFSVEKSNTQLKETIAELTRAQGQLVQSEKMASLGQLTAGIAHEINNPINYVSSSTEALMLDFQDIQKILLLLANIKDSDISSEQIQKIVSLKNEIDIAYTLREMEELIAGIEEGANRTQEIVKGLRTFSRNTSESFHPANIEEGIDSTLLIINHQISNDISIIKNYGKIPAVNCQISKLNQVFLNLIVNALQAIESRPTEQKEKGRIQISTEQKGENVLVQIQDNGIGMTPEIRRKIFEPFYTTKEVGKGTGLGLSVSYGIIIEHQGSIDVESTPETGTTFLIRLPIRPKGRDEG